jgi:hypothetical protein
VTSGSARYTSLPPSTHRYFCTSPKGAMFWSMVAKSTGRVSHVFSLLHFLSRTKSEKRSRYVSAPCSPACVILKRIPRQVDDLLAWKISTPSLMIVLPLSCSWRTKRWVVHIMFVSCCSLNSIRRHECLRACEILFLTSGDYLVRKLAWVGWMFCKMQLS